MSNGLQFALTFTALVVLATIVYVRLIRYDSYLREEKDGIQRLNERLQALVDSLQALGTQRVESQLGDILEVLEGVREGLGRRGPSGGAAAAADTSVIREIPRRAGILDVVEAKLYNMGYGKVAVVGDVEDPRAGEPVRVVVEAERDGVIHKGYLVIVGSAVTELDLQPAYTSFP